MEEQQKNPVGRPKIFKHPDEIYAHFEQYKQWSKENPILKEDYVGKDADRVERKLQRPLTWFGFEIFLRKRNVCDNLDDYRHNKNEAYGEFSNILRAIEKEIYENKYSGAAVGIFQQNIIARDLGLVDKKETDFKASKPVVIDWLGETITAQTKEDKGNDTK